MNLYLNKLYLKSTVWFTSLLCVWMMLIGIAGALANQNPKRPITIIPQPVKMEIHSGEFSITANTKIICSRSGRDVRLTADYFAEKVRKVTGFVLPVTDQKKGSLSNVITFQIIHDKKLGNEGYELNVDSNSIVIRANTSAGLFYGVQTIFQLLPPELFGITSHPELKWSIPAVSIFDVPRFKWRGMHLDVSRHFFPKEFVKKYIDDIVMYKMNTFHWHLTDDQGWRIEIKKYPLLTTIGAWRKGSMIGPYSDQKFDSIRYGGFYTQDDIREVVAYAASRHVTVVPEIEMPGHSLAALASYPKLSCTGGPFDVGESWGVYDDVCCPREATFTFLENVLTEVCKLFPGKYIHIGGDECPKIRWKTCADCQKLMKRKKLKNENQLQSYFTKRIEKFVNSKGKQIIGWDEILEGGLAPNAAVMSWRGTAGGIAAAKKKHFVVMSPGSHCYFDYYQGNPKYEPLAIGGYTPVEKVYSYEPIPDVLSSSQRQYILGAQGNMWTEYVATPEHVEYMIFPRICALAEVVWSPKELRNYSDFRERLIRHFTVLDILGIHYSKALYEIQTTIRPLPTADGISVALSSAFDSTGIRYTLDASRPTPTSLQYRMPIAITKSSMLTFASFDRNGQHGNTLDQEFVVSKSTGKPISLKKPPDEKYFDQGPFTLVNGVRGDPHHFGKDWLGFWGPNLEATIDLQQSEQISSVTLDLLEEKESWIYYPKSIEVFVGNDTTQLMSVKRIGPDDIKKTGNVVEINIGNQTARFVKVIAENAGRIPDGNPGAGSAAWLFVDEIMVK